MFMIKSSIIVTNKCRPVHSKLHTYLSRLLTTQINIICRALILLSCQISGFSRTFYNAGLFQFTEKQQLFAIKENKKYQKSVQSCINYTY